MMLRFDKTFLSISTDTGFFFLKLPLTRLDGGLYIITLMY